MINKNPNSIIEIDCYEHLVRWIITYHTFMYINRNNKPTFTWLNIMRSSIPSNLYWALIWYKTLAKTRIKMNFEEGELGCSGRLVVLLQLVAPVMLFFNDTNIMLYWNSVGHRYTSINTKAWSSYQTICSKDCANTVSTLIAWRNVIGWHAPQESHYKHVFRTCLQFLVHK